jgi:hypothetical protein
MVDHEGSINDQAEGESAPPRTMKHLLDAVAANKELTDCQRNNIRSGVRSLLNRLGLQIESTPADLRFIADRANRLTPASAQMTASRLRNCRYYLDRAFALHDTGFGRRRNRNPFAPKYAALIKKMPDRWVERSLRRLFHFATALNVEPKDIDDAFFDRFLQHLRHTTLPRPATSTAKRAKRGIGCARRSLIGLTSRSRCRATSTTGC